MPRQTLVSVERHDLERLIEGWNRMYDELAMLDEFHEPAPPLSGCMPDVSEQRSVEEIERAIRNG